MRRILLIAVVAMAASLFADESRVYFYSEVNRWQKESGGWKPLTDDGSENPLCIIVTDESEEIIGYVFAPAILESRQMGYDEGTCPREKLIVPSAVIRMTGEFRVYAKIGRKDGGVEMVAAQGKEPPAKDDKYDYESLYFVNGRQIINLMEAPCISCFE